jgi:hypothetical protein
MDSREYKVILDTLVKNYGDRILIGADGEGGSLESLIALLKEKCKEAM